MIGMGKSNVSSCKCPHCGEAIKAHKGNNFNFKDLTEKQMNSSIVISAINLRRSLCCKAKKFGSFNKSLVSVIRILVK
jgi:hypothetical protein